MRQDLIKAVKSRLYMGRYMAVLLFCLLGRHTAEAQASTIYAYDTNGIYTINASTGASTSIYAFSPALTWPAALAVRGSDGMIYFTDDPPNATGGSNGDGNGNVYRWNPATPATAPVLLGSTGAGSPYLPRLTFGPNGVLYAVNSRSGALYTINQTNGTATSILTMSPNPSGGGDIAFAPDGTLYMAMGTNLYTVNTTTGVVTTVGAVTGLSGSITGLAFDSSGVLLAATSSAPGNIYKVPLSAGGVSLVGSTGITLIADLASTPRASAPTAVAMKQITARQRGSEVIVQWATGYEANNLGFRVYRESGGERRLLNESLVAGSAFLTKDAESRPGGFRYAWKDNNPVAGAAYWVEDVDLNGATTWHGPVYAVAGGKQASPAELPAARSLGSLNQQADAKQREFAPAAKAPAKTASEENAAKSSVANANPGAKPAVKIAVNRDGWYRVSRAELLAAGLPVGADVNGLRLFKQNREQALLVNADGAAEFYGQAVDTGETDAGVYFLTWEGGQGARVPVNVLETAPATAARSFAWTVERSDRSIYFGALRNGAASNFFGAVVGGAQAVPQTLSLQDVDPQGGDAKLEARLQGATVGVHTVRVTLNGAEVGVINFTGEETGVLRVNAPASLLRSGDNTIALQALAGASDYSLVARLRLTYPRFYQAVNNTLVFTQRAGQSAGVAGFDGKDVRLFDITDPAAVTVWQAEAVAAGNGYTLQMPDAKTERRWLALGGATAPLTPAKVWANQPSNLRGAQKGADFIILTHAAFRAAAEQLAALRRAGGLRVQVVDVEDVYDEFDGGQPAAQAIKDFLNSTVRWSVRPRYALLFGAGNFDPRNYLATGAVSFIPVPTVNTAEMETASDDWYGDADDDGRPEIALGRLPARALAEASAMVAKLAAYERQASMPSRGALFVSDNGFANDSQRLQTYAAQRMPVATLARGAQSDEQMRQTLLARANAGPALVNYNGHGSVEVWTGSGLFQSADAAQLANGSALSVYVMMDCLNGFHHDLWADSLAAALVRAPNGGAVAAWASSGLTEAQGQTVMGEAFYRQLFAVAPTGNALSAVRLGDAIRAAKAATTDEDVRRTWSLLGDPTIFLR
jgi:hypothetical protein